MAVVPICYKLPCKDQTFSTVKGCAKNEGLFNRSEFSASFSTKSDITSRRRRSRQSYKFTDCLISWRSRNKMNYSKVECATTEVSSTEKQLRSLESYFGKLKDNVDEASLNSINDMVELVRTSRESMAEKELESLNKYLSKLSKGEGIFLDQSKAKKGLESLGDYLGKVDRDANSKNYVTSSEAKSRESAGNTFKQRSGNVREKVGTFMGLENGGGQDGSYDTTSSLYLIGIFASINIAVFLFEIATPVRNSELEIFSLPLLYGAKINHLILIGEWWRLVTSMFLHSGIFHIALGCWMLFSFGPQVCRAYGSFTFVMIYILGGLAGNFTSFLHTSQPTVGGTGPVFAVLGAWLVCQILNQEALGKVATESMFQKAMIATALSCVLSNFGPIDDWTHYGAAFTGIAYGFLTCSVLQMDDTSSKNVEEGIRLVTRYVYPCKSLLYFSVFILVLCSTVFLVEPPLE